MTMENVQVATCFLAGLVYGLFATSVFRVFGEEKRAWFMVFFVIVLTSEVLYFGAIEIFGCLIAVALGRLFASCFE